MNSLRSLRAAVAIVFALAPMIAAQVAPGPARPKLPDLRVESVAVDAEGFLTVRVVNGGAGSAPGTAGSLQIIVDGRDQGTVAFRDLGSAAPLAPGTARDVRTRLRLTGPGRRVAIVVDPDNAVREENELRNVATFTIDARTVAAPAVIVDDIGVSDSGLLFFTVANAGTVDLPAGARLRSRVVLNDTWMVSDFLIETNGLRANRANRAVVFPTPPQAVVPPYSDYSIVVRSTDGSVDHSRAELRASFPRNPLAVFAPLLADARITQALTWEDAAGPRSYPQWPASLKDELARALVNAETTPVAARPSKAAEAPLLSADEARKVYIAHVAHALWLEPQKTLSWRLPALEVDALRRLLDSRWLLSRNGDGYRLDGGRLPAWIAPDPRVPYELLLAILPALRQADGYRRSPVQLTFDPTIYEVGDWIRASTARDPAAAGSALADALFPARRRRVAVRDGAAVRRLFVGLLRSINIPIDDTTGDSKRLQFFVGDLSDLAIIDTDVVLDSLLAPSGDAIPAATMFVPEWRIGEILVNPRIDCSHVVPSRCNTVEEQRAFNFRQQLVAAVESALPDALLRVRCSGTAAQFDAMLTGTYARPFLDAETQARVSAEADARLIQEGGGNRPEGCRRVEARWQRYLAGQ